MLYEDLTKEIIHAAQEVHGILGFGFLEAVYGNALYKELMRKGIKCECQKMIDVYYKGEKVGHYVVDMVIGGQGDYRTKGSERDSSRTRMATD